MKIMTASWFAKIPATHLKVGTSRGVPRGMPAGYKRCRALEPGDWFKSVSVAEYLRLYNLQLSRLDPQQVVDDLTTAAGGKVPVMVCFESVPKILTGETWCHRHLVAKWLEDKLGIVVEEVDHPELDRFAKLRLSGVPIPNY